jgi:hypothetical protein
VESIYFAPASSRTILMRMLANLLFIFERAGEKRKHWHDSGLARRSSASSTFPSVPVNARVFPLAGAISPKHWLLHGPECFIGRKKIARLFASETSWRS